MTDEELQSKLAEFGDYSKRPIVTHEGVRLLAQLTHVASEMRVRIRGVKELMLWNPKLPGTAHVLQKLNAELERATRKADQIENMEFADGMKYIGVEMVDKKKVKRQREKAKREKRKSEGNCIECPSTNVRRAAHGSARCDECGHAHKLRNRNYRQRTKKLQEPHERGPNDDESGNSTANGSATASEQVDNADRTSAQPASAEHTLDETAIAKQIEAQRSDAGGGLPILTRRKQ